MKHRLIALKYWLAAFLLLCTFSLVQSQVARPPVAGAANIGIAPYTVRGTDGSTQFVVLNVPTAVDYLQVQAGTAGTGVTFSTQSATDTNAPLGFVSLGISPVNIGTGEFVTPVAAFSGDTAALPTYPSFQRFLNAVSGVSLSVFSSTTGSFILRPPSYDDYDGTVAGSGAVDLQQCNPFDNTRIATGANAFAANCNNIASGQYAAAFGNFTTASGLASTSYGTSSTANAADCYAGGTRGSCLGGQGTLAQGGGDFFSSSGSAQYRRQTGMATVTGTSATRITVGGGAASTSTVLLPLSSNNRVTKILGCTVIACVTATCDADFKTWTYGPTYITRGASAATTAVGSTTVTAVDSVGTPGTIAITAAADTTNAGLNLSATASDDKDMHVVATCEAVDVR